MIFLSNHNQRCNLLIKQLLNLEFFVVFVVVVEVELKLKVGLYGVSYLIVIVEVKPKTFDIQSFDNFFQPQVGQSKFPPIRHFTIKLDGVGPVDNRPSTD